LPINQKLDYSANNIDIKNKENSSITLNDPSSLPKLQKPNTKNILNLFNHNNFNSIPTKNLTPNNVYSNAQGAQNKKSILGSINMNMNLYPIKVENDVYNIDIKSGAGGNSNSNNLNQNPNTPNKLFTRLNPKIMTPLNPLPTKLVPKEKMHRDIKIKN
jgi:hypothetical protein